MKSSVGAVLEEDVDDTYKGGPPTEKWGGCLGLQLPTPLAGEAEGFLLLCLCHTQ